MKALYICLLVGITAPYTARAQTAPDAPLAVLDTCPPGSVVLAPEVAVATAKRLASAEAKVQVYEAHPPLPWWGVLIVAAVAAGAGAGLTVAIYEGTKKP